MLKGKNEYQCLFCEEKYQIFTNVLFPVLAIDFNTAKILKNPRAYTTSTIKEDSKPTIKVWNIVIVKNVLTCIIFNIIEICWFHIGNVGYNILNTCFRKK